MLKIINTPEGIAIGNLKYSNNSLVFYASGDSVGIKMIGGDLVHFTHFSNFCDEFGQQFTSAAAVLEELSKSHFKSTFGERRLFQNISPSEAVNGSLKEFNYPLPVPSHTSSMYEYYAVIDNTVMPPSEFTVTDNGNGTVKIEYITAPTKHALLTLYKK